jgi:hypothetical protein
MGLAAQAPVSGPTMGSAITASPAAPTLAQVASGALAATTYFVKLTWNTAGGESLPGAEASLAVLINNVLTVTPSAPPQSLGANGVQSITGFSIYVSNTAGGGSGAETKQANNVALGTTWTEPNTGLVAGTAPPTIGIGPAPGAVQPMGQPIATVPLSGLGADNPGRQSSGSNSDGHSGF